MSDHQKTTQAQLSAREEPVPHKKMEKFALYTEDGRNVADIIADLEGRIETLES